LLTLVDDYIETFIKEKRSNVSYTSDFEQAVLHGEYLVIATPTDYDESTDYFDTSSIEEVIEKQFKSKLMRNSYPNLRFQSAMLRP
jgi:UDPglucose 6-dehydrogenase